MHLDGEIYCPEFDFRYEGELYNFRNFTIVNQKEEALCRVDLTATSYANNDVVYLLVCKQALSAYYRGVEDGREAMRKAVNNLLGGHA